MADSATKNAAETKALMDLAHNVTLGQLLHQQANATTALEGDTLLDALRTLKESGFHSLPVVNDQGVPVGVISRFDILRAVVRAIFKAAGDRQPGQVKGAEEGSRAAVLAALAVPVGQVVASGEQSDVDQLWKYPAAEKMAKALEIFGLGARHLVVTGPFPAREANDGATEEEEKSAVGDEKTLRVLAQIDLVQGLLNLYLSNSLKNLDDHTTLSSVFGQTAGAVKNLGDGGAAAVQVLTVPRKQSVLEAMLHLSEQGYNAAPVVDDSGAVTGTVSTDTVVKMLAEDGSIDLAFMDRDVSTLHGEDAQPVICSAGADLAQVATLMLDENVHRVWVCADGKKPVAVLSCSDIVFAVGGEDAVMEDAGEQ